MPIVASTTHPNGFDSPVPTRFHNKLPKQQRFAAAVPFLLGSWKTVDLGDAKEPIDGRLASLRTVSRPRGSGAFDRDSPHRRRSRHFRPLLEANHRLGVVVVSGILALAVYRISSWYAVANIPTCSRCGFWVRHFVMGS